MRTVPPQRARSSLRRTFFLFSLISVASALLFPRFLAAREYFCSGISNEDFWSGILNLEFCMRPAGRALVSLFSSPLAGAQSSPQSSISDLAAKAESFEAQGRFLDAAAEYRQILKLDPRSVPALNALGALSVKQGDFKEGISYYQRALKINPGEFGTNLNLGIALIKMQDYKSAAPALERAAEIDPSSFQAQELLGVALIARDQYARAIRWVLSVTQREP